MTKASKNGKKARIARNEIRQVTVDAMVDTGATTLSSYFVFFVPL